MKIVNLEAEIKRTCQAVCGHDRKDCRWAHCKPGEGCTVIERLEEAQPVEAIPVEYLMNYAQLPTEFAIAAWRKQDKDAQEKRIKRLDKPMSLDDALNRVNDVFPLGQKEQEAKT